ncbi:UDP-N-acetylmuramate dehydrogenase [Winogradskyella sp. DF17]|uniref:UDP-N-acetylenolpyruvoylglucosamine reductase n=1 Tax=Winogradskyella pelagia TaxID=2819984 RepID=A0ABS3T0T7_9FLAO|nr:UDP-N-acetylmuramate dehydrogenase [Winogradskyella sp. DF17]MBO3115869.1 UDP-N-acetylmuramate dehydrogenase [Winogradskyella sp. DF17]
MPILQNVPLRNLNTFGINANAKEYCNIATEDYLKKVLTDNAQKSLFILGGGSNMLLTRDINALVLHINLKGIEVIENHENHVIVKAMAGENWHDFVLWCISNNYGGVENLSLIPGNVGTAPIQNIGAYGVELKDTLVSCTAVHIKNKTTQVFSNEECRFGYRESVFKNELKGEFIVTSVNFKLTTSNHKINIDYGAIKQELKAHNIEDPSIKDISNAVITIRKSKLPDPKVIGNSGSFFKNPVISQSHYKELQNNFEDIPSYQISETEIKIPAGWLIEKAGFKGKRFGNYGVHNKQALVLVNYGNAKGSDIYDLAKLIQKTVLRLFEINIETEVNII